MRPDDQIEMDPAAYVQSLHPAWLLGLKPAQARLRAFPAVEILLGLAAVLPAIYLIYAVVRFPVNVPFWDEWLLVDFLDRANSGALTPADFWAQHNEQRLVLPKAIILGLAQLNGWDISQEVLVSVFFAICTFGLVVWQARATFHANGNPRAFYWSLPAISLLCFSMSHAENWLWGWQINVFLVLLAATAGLFLLADPSASPWRFACSVALGFVAVYSFASGMAYWVVGLGVLGIHHAVSRRGVGRLVIWALAGSVAIGGYLYGFQYPSYYPDSLSALRSPLETLLFMLNYLGQPMALFSHQDQAAAVGGLGLVVFGLTGWHLVSVKKARLLDLIPYAALAAFAVGAAGMAALGRVGFHGSESAFQGRYVTLATPLWVADVVLLGLLVAPGHGSAPRATLARDLGIGTLALVLLFAARSWADGNRHYLWQHGVRVGVARQMLQLNNPELLERVRASEVVSPETLERLFYPALIDRYLPLLVEHKWSLFHGAPPAGPQFVAVTDFGGKVRLMGYDLEPLEAEAGQALEVTLYWQQLSELERPYSAFVHLVDGDWRMWAQADGPPGGEGRGGSGWGDGHLLKDHRRLQLAPDLSAGPYRIEVGVYATDTLERLDVRGRSELPDRLLTVPVIAP